ncbi:MAG: T9SS type A sorting domain-containing protein, partial [Bacteroidales bacterium]|nr:T9SS type A sorting domain-containing protein [Bacteroidales bacterium]
VSISDNQISDIRFLISDIRLFDVMGRQISIVGKSEIGQSEIAISIAHLPNGIYFIRIQTDEEVVVRKVVKE